ncbi:MAG TPA: trypsin-like peptidase domain-containing protein [Flavobacteriaceae bacterium]|nr:trypsin-like peptidase domain-containing protein [Flavobacteriaceae bacterium]
MKKILTLVFASILGGIITLTSYKLVIEEQPVLVSENSTNTASFLQTSNTTSTNNINPVNAPDLTVAAEKAVHSVVHVKNTAIVSSPLTIEDFFFGRQSQRAQVGTGSGVIISPDGYIITNNHVIAGARDIAITLNDNRTYEAELIGTDSKTDIALLKIDAEEELPYTTFADSDQARIGEWVLAVGNPFNLNSTVTAGIISAKSRDLSGENYQSFIQTDAAVNPGNSGGALVNVNGELIGINTAITSQTGSYIGYSFAVPSNIARKVVADIMEFGNVQNGILGVSGTILNGTTANDLELNLTEGFYVDNVEDASGAKKAGIIKGDVITKIDQVKISKFADLTGYLNTKRPGDVVNLTVLRANNEKVIPVKLSKVEIMKVEFMEMELRNLPSSVKEKYNIDNGLLVVKNNNYKLYRKVGLNAGYIITEINGIKLHSVEDINKLKRKYGNLEDNIEKMSIINQNGQRIELYF